jgi:hypothetical protein
METGRTRNQRYFRLTLTDFIGPFRLTLSATELAILQTGLQSSSPGSDYLQLTKATYGTLPTFQKGT